MADAKAGDGNPHVFTSNPDAAGPAYESDNKHYIGFDAATWFVNDQSGFFKDRMVAGTIEVTINGKTFPVVLGQYELKAGEKVAPVFDRALITSVPYLSGDIVFKCVIQGNKKNTVAGALLKQMATASLSAVAGALTLETAGLAGTLLAGASGTLVKGAQQALSDNSDKKVDILNSDVTIHPIEQLRGAASYVLLHHGTDGFVAKDFTVPSGGNAGEFQSGVDVQRGTQPFRDGAWLLLRIRRSDTYIGNPRPWQEGPGGLSFIKQLLNELIDQWSANQIKVEDVKKNLQKTTNETPSIADQVGILRRRIRTDEGLTDKDRNKYAAIVQAYLIAAQNSADANDPKKYAEAIAAIDGAIKNNTPKPSILTDALVAEFRLANEGNEEFQPADAAKITFAENLL